MKLNGTVERRQGRSGFTLAEVMVTVFLLGILTAGLMGAFSASLGVVQSARENLRATQILMQKTEAVRLLTWGQGTNTSLAPTSFTDYYDPTGGSLGATYAGTYSITSPLTNMPVAYSSNLRLITVTVYWTNYTHYGRTAIVHSRQMQTQVAHYGMQSYVFK